MTTVLKVLILSSRHRFISNFTDIPRPRMNLHTVSDSERAERIFCQLTITIFPAFATFPAHHQDIPSLLMDKPEA